MRRSAVLVWFVIFLVWAFYRAFFTFPEFVDELLVKPLVFVAPVLYLILVRQKKPLSDLGLAITPKSALTDLYIGVAIGCVFAIEGLLINPIKYGSWSFATLPAFKESGGLVPFLALSVATGLWEEILGRGYLFKRFYNRGKNLANSAVFSSFLFTFLHVPILFTRLHLSGAALLVYPVSILLLGIVNCYLFEIRKTLLLPVIIHVFWNMTVAMYL